RLPSTRTTPKPRLAAPGSIPITTCMGSDSGTRPGCLLGPAGRNGANVGLSTSFAPAQPGRGLGDREFLENGLAHVEVRVPLVDVVGLLERVDELEQPFGLAALDQDRAFRLHRLFGRDDLYARCLQCLANGAEIGRVADDAQLVTVLAHVLGAGVDRS